jgi:hypothetical protein
MSSYSRDRKLVSSPPMSPTAAPVPIVTWRNVFVVVDHGNLGASEIEVIAQRVLELGLRHGNGVGGITIIPARSRPPSESQREAIKRAYTLVSRHLKAMCWTVDGHGFRAATLRAGLAGLRLFLNPPFPTRIANSIEDGVAWLSGQLHVGTANDVHAGLQEIRRQLITIDETRQSLGPSDKTAPP